MKKLVLVLCLVVNLLATDYNLNLVDFARHTAKVNNVNILVPDEFKQHTYSFTINTSLNNSIGFFRRAIEMYDLQLIRGEDFYYVDRKEKAKLKHHILKVNHINYNEIKNFMEIFTSNKNTKNDEIKYEYIAARKVLLVKCTDEDFKSISQTLLYLDKTPTQKRLKITIIDTNLDEIKERGIETDVQYKDNHNFFFNLLAYPFSVTNNISTTDKTQFYSFIRFLDQDGISKLVSSPIVTLTDEKNTIFKVVENVPFRKGSTVVDSSNVSTTEQIEYKDVGLIVNIKPSFLHRSVSLDLNLNLSSIASNADNLLRTIDRQIIQTFTLKEDEILVLTGINQKQTNQITSGIPLLRDIPILSYLTSYESETETNTNLTITFELVD
jgi:general secretion pathway protein D